MAESNDGPPLIRPIPRRVFDLNPKCPTPPDEDQPILPPSSPSRHIPLNLESLNSRLLSANTDYGSDAPSESGSISRAQSILNLTGSTLMGIYGPSSNGRSRDEAQTPWGTGAETPARDLNVDEPYFETLKERAHATRRRSSHHQQAATPTPISTTSLIFHLGLRTVLLASLGTVYGVIVAQVQGGHKIASLYVEGMISPSSYDWRYLAFWALSGVALGSLLPWFDQVWAAVVGLEEAEATADQAVELDEDGEKPNAETDWALAIRGVGAFVGIAFAIRKVPWDSAMQASLTLALVNPVLWFLIDRSTPGFILSATVGLAGSLALMGLKPDMVPAPTNPLSAFAGDFTPANATAAQLDTVLLGGLVRQQTMETGIWMLSVLFCCCVCFGNVGRRLALDRSAIAKGR